MIVFLETDERPREYATISREENAVKKIVFFSDGGAKTGESSFILLKWKDGRVESYSSNIGRSHLPSRLKEKKFTGKLKGLEMDEWGDLFFGNDHFWIPGSEGKDVVLVCGDGYVQQLIITDGKGETIAKRDRKDALLTGRDEWTAVKQRLLDNKKILAMQVVRQCRIFWRRCAFNNEEVLPEVDKALKEAVNEGETSDEKLAMYMERRSEERRVGKECRSRWSPYH